MKQLVGLQAACFFFDAAWHEVFAYIASHVEVAQSLHYAAEKGIAETDVISPHEQLRD
jgi:hypothetical protein